MPTEHKDLTGANLHEPKGAAAAGANTLYVANGSGSGTWGKIGPSNLDTTLPVPNRYCLVVVLTDVSTASSEFVTVPFNSTFVSAYGVLQNGVSVADSIVTFEKNAAVSFGSSMTVAQSGSAAGSVFSYTPSANQSMTAGQFIKVITDGASTTTAKLTVTLVLDKV